MTYGEQLREALAGYEAVHGRAQMIGMTPAMYGLIKDENEKAGMNEPQGGWCTFYGVKIDVQEVADVPLFWFNGSIIIYKPHKPIDVEKITKGVKCHSRAKWVKDCEGCPYKGNFVTCSLDLCADVLEYFKEKGEDV